MTPSINPLPTAFSNAPFAKNVANIMEKAKDAFHIETSDNFKPTTGVMENCFGTCQRFVDLKNNENVQTYNKKDGKTVAYSNSDPNSPSRSFIFDSEGKNIEYTSPYEKASIVFTDKGYCVEYEDIENTNSKGGKSKYYLEYEFTEDEMRILETYNGVTNIYDSIYDENGNILRNYETRYDDDGERKIETQYGENTVTKHTSSYKNGELTSKEEQLYREGKLLHDFKDTNGDGIIDYAEDHHYLNGKEYETLYRNTFNPNENRTVTHYYDESGKETGYFVDYENNDNWSDFQVGFAELKELLGIESGLDKYYEIED